MFCYCGFKIQKMAFLSMIFDSGLEVCWVFMGLRVAKIVFS